ncbi:pimeloyl-ACP methyl ester carboxylesterase [Rhizobium sp. 1399]|nr:pimeloyl-ACP methyl ester carboxylesterase [Rhizobium sp. 1399]
MSHVPALIHVSAGVLNIAYYESGPADGTPTILLHGFPYDDVAMTLSTSGSRCIVPFLRGYGQTRFLSQETPRSGEQAALGADLLALMDSLSIEKAILGGYDWAGRAACIVAAHGRKGGWDWPAPGLPTAARTSLAPSIRVCPIGRRATGINTISIPIGAARALTSEPVDRTWRSAPQMQTRALTDNGLGVIQSNPGGAWSSYAPGQRQISRRQRLSAFHVP